MKHTGEIEIKEGFTLVNPTMEVQGIFDHLDEDDNFIRKYLEIYFVDDKGHKHSREWTIEEGVTVEDFIASHDVLNKFK